MSNQALKEIPHAIGSTKKDRVVGYTVPIAVREDGNYRKNLKLESGQFRLSGSQTGHLRLGL
jgi:hypothetical protein